MKTEEKKAVAEMLAHWLDEESLARMIHGERNGTGVLCLQEDYTVINEVARILDMVEDLDSGPLRLALQQMNQPG